MKPRKPRALGAYIFAGGFTLGVSRHFEVVGQLEDGPFGVETTRANFPGLRVVDDRDRWDDYDWSDVEFMFCNPPCIAWSNMAVGRHFTADKWRTDERVECSRRSFDLFQRNRFPVFALESVSALLTKGREVAGYMTDAAIGMGYHVYHVLHDAKFMGLPQQRRRVFLVASRYAIDWERPSGGIVSCGEVLSRMLSDYQGIGNVAQPRKSIVPFISQLKPGEHPLRAWERENPDLAGVRPEKGRMQGRPRFTDHRLDGALPSSTIVGVWPPPQIHPYEDRHIGVGEAAALCGFPPGYTFVAAKPEHALWQVARGVTPVAGEWLARNVAKAIVSNQAARPGLTLVDYQAETPRLRDGRMRSLVSSGVRA